VTTLRPRPFVLQVVQNTSGSRMIINVLLRLATIPQTRTSVVTLTALDTLGTFNNQKSSSLAQVMS